MLPMRDNIGLVLNDPFDEFSFFKLHCFRNGRREVDVVLICGFFPSDELNFCWVSHVLFLLYKVFEPLALMLEPRLNEKLRCDQEKKETKKNHCASRRRNLVWGQTTGVGVPPTV